MVANSDVIMNTIRVTYTTPLYPALQTRKPSALYNHLNDHLDEPLFSKLEQLKKYHENGTISRGCIEIEIDEIEIDL